MTVAYLKYYKLIILLDEWTPVEIAENCVPNKSTSVEPNNRKWFSCTDYNGRLFIFGGLIATRTTEKYFPNVDVFEPGKNTWKELEPMINARRFTEVL